MPTVTPSELGAVLDLAAKASAPAGVVYALSPVLTKLIELAGGTHPIGAVVPAAPFELDEPDVAVLGTD